MENPRWFSRVFRAVGLTGDGETGVGGSGDLSGRVEVVAVGRARASLGLAARASILAILMNIEICQTISKTEA